MEDLNGASDDGVVERLRALGRVPVDPATQSAHLSAMAAAAPVRRPFASRLKLAAAVFAGFLVGSTGLAAAGALGPLQPVAHTVIEKTTPLNVPDGKGKADHGQPGTHGTARVTDCPAAAQGQTFKNHGQYVKWVHTQPADQQAALMQSRCGMPTVSNGTPGTDDTTDANEPPETDQKSGAGNGSSASNGKSNGKSDGAPGASTTVPDDQGRGAANGKSGAPSTVAPTPSDNGNGRGNEPATTVPTSTPTTSTPTTSTPSTSTTTSTSTTSTTTFTSTTSAAPTTSTEQPAG